MLNDAAHRWQACCDFHSGDMNSQRGTTTEAYLQPYDNWMKSARERAVESDQRATFDGFGNHSLVGSITFSTVMPKP